MSISKFYFYVIRVSNSCVCALANKCNPGKGIGKMGAKIKGKIIINLRRPILAKEHIDKRSQNGKISKISNNMKMKTMA